MVIEKTGDVIEAFKSGEILILAHGCNMSGGFGSGVAGQIAKEFPEAKTSYLDCYVRGYLSLGFIDPVSIEENFPRKQKNKYILNCITQEKYGYDGELYASYEAIEEVAQKLESYARVFKKPIGIPRIGCGLAGGDWKIVKAILEKYFVGTNITVYTLDQK